MLINLDLKLHSITDSVSVVRTCQVRCMFAAYFVTLTWKRTLKKEHCYTHTCWKDHLHRMVIDCSIAGLRGRHWGFQLFLSMSPTSPRKIVPPQTPLSSSHESVPPQAWHRVLWACKWFSKNQSVISKILPLAWNRLHRRWSKLPGEGRTWLNSFLPRASHGGHICCHLIPRGRHYCSHLTDKQVKVQRSWVTYPRSHNWEMDRISLTSGLKTRPMTSLQMAPRHKIIWP